MQTFDVVSALLSYEDIDSSKLFGIYANTSYEEKKWQEALKKSNDITCNSALREIIY